MNVEGFVKLSEIFRRARFFQSDIGTKAILDLVKIYEQWELDFVRDAKLQGELSDNILKLWRADKITTPPPPLPGPAMLSILRRRRRAAKPSEAERLLGVEPETARRFVWRCQSLLETGEVIEPEPIKPLTIEEYQDADTEKRLEERKQRRMRLASLATARRAQKMFKRVNIPINFDTTENSIFFDWGNSDYVNSIEREYVDRVIGSAAQASGLRYFPQYDVGKLQYGLLTQFVSEARMADLYGA
ncbi:MAG: hypothetical protein [Microviridae sp.]|nr:MAG: hypothetical protein [Microviridae sp.]